jgi:hypothetical protein
VQNGLSINTKVFTRLVSGDVKERALASAIVIHLATLWRSQSVQKILVEQAIKVVALKDDAFDAEIDVLLRSPVVATPAVGKSGLGTTPQKKGDASIKYPVLIVETEEDRLRNPVIYHDPEGVEEEPMFINPEDLKIVEEEEVPLKRPVKRVDYASWVRNPLKTVKKTIVKAIVAKTAPDGTDARDHFSGNLYSTWTAIVLAFQYAFFVVPSYYGELFLTTVGQVVTMRDNTTGICLLCTAIVGFYPMIPIWVCVAAWQVRKPKSWWSYTSDVWYVKLLKLTPFYLHVFTTVGILTYLWVSFKYRYEKKTQIHAQGPDKFLKTNKKGLSSLFERLSFIGLLAIPVWFGDAYTKHADQIKKGFQAASLIEGSWTDDPRRKRVLAWIDGALEDDGEYPAKVEFLCKNVDKGDLVKLYAAQFPECPLNAKLAKEGKPRADSIVHGYMSNFALYSKVSGMINGGAMVVLVLLTVLAVGLYFIEDVPLSEGKGKTKSQRHLRVNIRQATQINKEKRRQWIYDPTSMAWFEMDLDSLGKLDGYYTPDEYRRYMLERADHYDLTDQQYEMLNGEFDPVEWFNSFNWDDIQKMDHVYDREDMIKEFGSEPDFGESDFDTLQERRDNRRNGKKKEEGAHNFAKFAKVKIVEPVAPAVPESKKIVKSVYTAKTTTKDGIPYWGIAKSLLTEKQVAERDAARVQKLKDRKAAKKEAEGKGPVAPLSVSFEKAIVSINGAFGVGVGNGFLTTTHSAETMKKFNPKLKFQEIVGSPSIQLSNGVDKIVYCATRPAGVKAVKIRSPTVGQAVLLNQRKEVCLGSVLRIRDGVVQHNLTTGAGDCSTVICGVGGDNAVGIGLHVGTDTNVNYALGFNDAVCDFVLKVANAPSGNAHGGAVISSSPSQVKTGPRSSAK